MGEMPNVSGGVCCTCRAPLVNQAFVVFLVGTNPPELGDIFFTCDDDCGQAAPLPLQEPNSYWTSGKVDRLLDMLDFIFPRQSDGAKQRIAEARALLKHAESFFPEAKFQDRRMEMPGAALSIAEMFGDIKPVATHLLGLSESPFRNYIWYRGIIVPIVAVKGCVNLSLEFIDIYHEVYQRVNAAPVGVAYKYLSELYDVIDIRPDKDTACKKALKLLRDLGPDLQESESRKQFLEGCREVMAATLPRKKFRP